MKFEDVLIEGRLIKRYKRFLADVTLADGREVTAHTPNTGSMKGCCDPGSRVWLRDSGNPSRKYPLSWEMVEAANGARVGINTALANQLVREGIENGVIEELSGYARCRPEVRYGSQNSRIDWLLSDDELGDCYVEVKNVTLAEDGVGYFPDAVSARGTKHLEELAEMAEAGHRGVLCFCVQRTDVSEVRPADHIDERYGRTLRQSLQRGLEVLAYRAEVSPKGIVLNQRLPVVFP